MKYRNYIISILFVEGFIALSFQMIFMRKLLMFVGSSVNYISIIIGVILLMMAFGYRYGGNRKDFDDEYLKNGDREGFLSSVSRRIGLNFLMVGLISGIALNDTIIRSIMFIDGSFISLIVYSILFISPIIFLMASTVPYIVRYFNGLEKEKAASVALYLSTIGSFAGSVITANILFRFFGLYETTIFVVFTIIVFGFYSLYISKSLESSKLYFYTGFTALLSGVFLVLGSQLSVVHSNEHYTYSVIENDRYKMFQVDESPSSLMWKKGHINESYIESIKRFIVSRFGGSEKEILVIGAGGFMASRGLSGSNYEFTYVDVDPDMKDVAEKYFLEEPVNGGYVVADGRAYLQNSDKKYDAIILDAYSNAKSIPENLSTIEFFYEVKKDLKIGGWFIVNVISDVDFDEDYGRNINRTINKAFPMCRSEVVGSGSYYANIIYTCRNLEEVGDVYIDNKNKSNIEFNDMGVFR